MAVEPWVDDDGAVRCSADVPSGVPARVLAVIDDAAAQALYESEPAVGARPWAEVSEGTKNRFRTVAEFLRGGTL